MVYQMKMGHQNQHLLNSIVRTLTFIVPIIILATPVVSSAHALGASFEATSTPYFIDIGYDPDPLETGRASRFEFELRNLQREMVKDHTYVWIRLVRSDETLLATGIHTQLYGPSTLLHTFETPGSYVLDVSYRTDDGSEIASAEFPFEVVRGENSGFTWLHMIIGILLLCAAALLAFAFIRKPRAEQ